jgi:methylation protein EvaC
MSNRTLIDFGKLPLANTLSNSKGDVEKTFPLIVGFDDQTKLVSLTENVDAEYLFPNDYVYDSSQSETMIKYFGDMAEYLESTFTPKTVLEIGSNSGIFINGFKNAKTIAVEPCDNFANKTNDMGIKTYPEYWSMELAKEIVKNDGKQDLIYSANTMTHIHEVDKAFEAVNECLSDDGVFVIDGPALQNILKYNAFDQFYHEHQSYFTCTALSNILNPMGLVIVGVNKTSVHGGSYQIMIQKIGHENSIKFGMDLGDILAEEQELGLDSYGGLKIHFDRIRVHIKDITDQIASLNGSKVVGYGATAKFTQICNMCDLDNNNIAYAMDTTPDKQNKFIPNTGIEILPFAKDRIDSVDYFYLGAWNYAEEIFKKEHEYIENGGKFITHVPEVTII